jgi:hypothetical protein
MATVRGPRTRFISMQRQLDLSKAVCQCSERPITLPSGVSGVVPVTRVMKGGLELCCIVIMRVVMSQSYCVFWGRCATLFGHLGAHVLGAC